MKLLQKNTNYILRSTRSELALIMNINPDRCVHKGSMRLFSVHRGILFIQGYSTEKQGEDTAGDSWRDWVRTGMPGGIVLVAYDPGMATKALID